MFKKNIRKFFLKIIIFIIAVLAIPTVITLVSNGKISTRIYSATESGKYVVINNNGIKEELDVENYIPCVLMGQLSIENEEELLKSFAVIMRTYILNLMTDKSSIDSGEIDIPYISYDEMEELWGDNFPENYNKLMKVVSDTSLQVISNNDKLISPYYHSVSAENTRNGVEVLGENFAYLCSVNCATDTTSPDYFKAYYYTNDDFASAIRDIDKNISIDEAAPLVNIQIVSKDSAGYILSLDIGGVTISGIDFYKAMNINSPSFLIEEYNDGIRITTYGVGHGLGLSLNHAASLASNGSSYVEILHYFYNNVEIK